MQINSIQNASNYSVPTFNGIQVKNECMKKILTERDIAELKKADTSKISKMCIKRYTDYAERYFFKKHPECKIDGMRQLCRNAIREKALGLLSDNDGRKEIDFEVVPTSVWVSNQDLDTTCGGQYDHYLNFYPCDFPFPIRVGWGIYRLGMGDWDDVKRFWRTEDAKSIQRLLNSYSSDKVKLSHGVIHFDGFDTCYEELVEKNDAIKALLNSPLYKEIQSIEQLNKEQRLQIKKLEKEISDELKALDNTRK